jgi:hypothetical protein
MKIRRYLGFDCDSEQGFNNGQYVDDTEVEVKDYDEAKALCMDALKEHLGHEVKENEVRDVGTDYPCIEFVTAHFDDDGNEISALEFLELNQNEEHGSWRYIYVSADLCPN